MPDTRYKRAAHFLLNAHLQNSPPNDAMRRVYHDCGYEIDMYSPDGDLQNNSVKPAFYAIKWTLMNVLKPHWRHYDAFSCTTEDPVVIAGILSFIWRKPLIVLSDEIKSGGYRGDRRELWKKLCRWALRQANLTIVNDQARVQLQRRYAGLKDTDKIVVYPGCFLQPPKALDRDELRSQWNIAKDQFVLGFSGACYLSTGIDLALDCLDSNDNVVLVTQPLGNDELTAYLMHNHRHYERLYIQKNKMTWHQSWASAAAMDVGIAFYRNQSDQFQLMGISSNRLCMFLAMGVPVLVNKQPSFQFVEDYNCGFMVETQEEFDVALNKILNNLEQMKANALRCTAEYINTQDKFLDLSEEMKSVLN